MDIQPGTLVEVTTARGDRVEMIALSRETSGRDLRIVWVIEPTEYQAHGDQGHRIPWPAQAVHALAAHKVLDAGTAQRGVTPGVHTPA